MRSSNGSANTSRQPGSPSRMAPCSKLRRICMVCGRVSATTVAPRSAAADARRQLAPGAVGVHGRHAEHVPVDRAVGQQRHGRHEVDLLVGEPVEAAGHDELERGALVVAHRGGQPLHLVAGRRRATAPAGRRRRCACAPARSRSRARPRRAPRAARPPWPPRPSGVAAPPTARSPMTSRRSVEWPTRNPAFTAMRPSKRPSHSPNEVQSQGSPARSAARGMPSTRAIIRLM